MATAAAEAIAKINKHHRQRQQQLQMQCIAKINKKFKMSSISNDVFVRRKVGLRSACNGESCQVFMSVEINVSTVVVVGLFIFIY